MDHLTSFALHNSTSRTRRLNYRYYPGILGERRERVVNSSTNINSILSSSQRLMLMLKYYCSRKKKFNDNANYNDDDEKGGKSALC